MIDKLKVFEVAWKEFVEWLYTKHGDYPFIYERGWGIKRKNEFISDRELYSLCIEWLDSRGIYISVSIYTVRSDWENQKLYTNQTIWETIITCYENHGVIVGKHSSRTEATEAGIIRAFEIYNQKEK